MSLNALIVDDEEYSRKSLYYLLAEHCKEIHVGGIAKSVAEAREKLAEGVFDMVFLDIAMPGENGFALLPDLKSEMVVFTTAYDQYALKALKAQALDYLLKPIDIEELQEACRKCTEFHNEKNRVLNAAVATTDPAGDKISLTHNQGFDIVNTSDIMYIEADSNYSVLHLQSGNTFVASKPLKEFEELLDQRFFWRIHKSILVNFQYITAYSNKNGFNVILRDDTELPVSRRRFAEFQEKVKLNIKK